MVMTRIPCWKFLMKNMISTNSGLILGYNAANEGTRLHAVRLKCFTKGDVACNI